MPVVQNLQTFSRTATNLSRSPLGIIALFIVLVYGIAALVVGLGRTTEHQSLVPLIYFMAVFPVAVLGVFGWLVSCHHTKLYAPSDFRDDQMFFRAMESIEIGRFDYAEPAAHPPSVPPVLTSERPTRVHAVEPPDLNTGEGRYLDREELRANVRNLFLVHVLKPSNQKQQTYDISIYVIRHEENALDDVTKAEFFFGRSWGNRIFPGSREHNRIGVTTSAYGSFLCTCLVTFKDGGHAMLYRYIDFEMGEALTQALKRLA